MGDASGNSAVAMLWTYENSAGLGVSMLWGRETFAFAVSVVLEVLGLGVSLPWEHVTFAIVAAVAVSV